MLYSRTLLSIHSVCNSLHLVTPNSQSIPPPLIIIRAGFITRSLVTGREPTQSKGPRRLPGGSGDPPLQGQGDLMWRRWWRAPGHPGAVSTRGLVVFSALAFTSSEVGFTRWPSQMSSCIEYCFFPLDLRYLSLFCLSLPSSSLL